MGVVIMSMTKLIFVYFSILSYPFKLSEQGRGPLAWGPFAGLLA